MSNDLICMMLLSFLGGIVIGIILWQFIIVYYIKIGKEEENKEEIEEDC